MSSVETGSSAPRGIRVILLAFLLCLHLAIALHSMWYSSATFDEPDCVGVGRFLYETGYWDVTVARINTPFVFYAQSLPTFLIDIPGDVWKVPRDRVVAYDDEVGGRILYGESGDPMTVLRIARLPTLVFSVLLLVIVFLWTESLFGRAAAGIAGLVYALEPNVLAAARLVTGDMFSALYFTAQFWTLDLLRRKFSWKMFGVAALMSAASLSARLNGFFMLPLGLVFLVVILKRSVPAVPHRLAALAVYGLLPFLLLWALYGFSVGPPLAAGGRGDVLDATLARLPPAVAGIARDVLDRSWPMPQYAAVWANMLALARRGFPAFLLGEFRDTGWWYYFPVAFLVKTPIPLLLLFLAGIWICARSLDRSAFALLLLPVLATVVPAMAGGLNYGFRHMLPAMPFLITIAAGAAARARTRHYRKIILILLVWLVIGAARVHPSHLSYFNEIAGGPEGGEEWLSDSNIDWGEDYVRLAEYQRRMGIEVLQFAPYPIIPPEVYGVCFRRPAGPVRGIMAVEVMAQQFARRRPDNPLAWLDSHKPIDRVGGSIKIYRVEPGDATAVSGR